MIKHKKKILKEYTIEEKTKLILKYLDAEISSLQKKITNLKDLKSYKRGFLYMFKYDTKKQNDRFYTGITQRPPWERFYEHRNKIHSNFMKMNHPNSIPRFCYLELLPIGISYRNYEIKVKAYSNQKKKKICQEIHNIIQDYNLILEYTDDEIMRRVIIVHKYCSNHYSEKEIEDKFSLIKSLQLRYAYLQLIEVSENRKRKH